MTSNGTETEQRYRVGEYTTNSLNHALETLLYEIKGTSNINGIERL